MKCTTVVWKVKVAPVVAIISCIAHSSIVLANELAIGTSAKTYGSIDIPIEPPADFNFKSRAEIFALREKEINKHFALLREPYQPDKSVFGAMKDGKPWWGDVGRAYYGSGENSIKGKSIVSRSILNPFLLAAVGTTLSLPRNRVTERDLSQRTYPTYYQATDLRWWPKLAKAEVTYNVSDYQRQISILCGVSNLVVIGGTHGGLAIELINAHDLGLGYLFIPPRFASNLGLAAPMSFPIPIPQFIHCGSSCGYPGGCNHISPPCPEIDKIMIQRLPARLVLLLWKTKPTERTPPDITYTMNFH